MPRGKDFTFIKSSKLALEKEPVSLDWKSSLAESHKYLPWLKDRKLPIAGLVDDAPAEAIEAWNR